jgi:hypothetical protein
VVPVAGVVVCQGQRAQPLPLGVQELSLQRGSAVVRRKVTAALKRATDTKADRRPPAG